MTPGLKSCPFCGQWPLLFVGHDPGDGWPYAQVRCSNKNCQIRTQKFFEWPGQATTPQEQAVTMWNTRV